MRNCTYSEYSVYNVKHEHSVRNHPLKSVSPEDLTKGIHVHRNLFKPLNHLTLLKKKEAIAIDLNLHIIKTDKLLFNKNYKKLEEHQNGSVPTKYVINQLYDQQISQKKEITEELIIEKLKAYATITHMEFHPTDICNLTCEGCTYGHDLQAIKPLRLSYPFHEIRKIQQLNPKSIVIIGGGEPTLYKDNGHRFNDVITEISTAFENVYLGLVTNGTFKPEGDWPSEFKWIRISLDASTPKTYELFRGKNYFKKVIDNYLKYLDHNSNSIGVSFLFSKTNIHEYASVIDVIYSLIVKEKPHYLNKVNIQFRPLRIDPSDIHDSHKYNIDDIEIKKVISEILDLVKMKPQIKEFVKYQTNVSAVLGGNTHPPHEFNRCYYSQMFHIVRANGDLYPCFIRVKELDSKLGNIIEDPLEKIALNTFLIAARRKKHCDPIGCRQCHVNYVFEKGLAGELNVSLNNQIKNDPFF